MFEVHIPVQSVHPEWREYAVNPKLSENQTPEEYWQVVFKKRDEWEAKISPLNKGDETIFALLKCS